MTLPPVAKRDPYNDADWETPTTKGSTVDRVTQRNIEIADRKRRIDAAKSSGTDPGQSQMIAEEAKQYSGAPQDQAGVKDETGLHTPEQTVGSGSQIVRVYTGPGSEGAGKAIAEMGIPILSQWTEGNYQVYKIPSTYDVKMVEEYAKDYGQSKAPVRTEPTYAEEVLQMSIPTEKMTQEEKIKVEKAASQTLIESNIVPTKESVQKVATSTVIKPSSTAIMASEDMLNTTIKPSPHEDVLQMSIPYEKTTPQERVEITTKIGYQEIQGSDGVGLFSPKSNKKAEEQKKAVETAMAEQVYKKAEEEGMIGRLYKHTLLSGSWPEYVASYIAPQILPEGSDTPKNIVLKKIKEMMRIKTEEERQQYVIKTAWEQPGTQLGLAYLGMAGLGYATTSSVKAAQILTTAPGKIAFFDVALPAMGAIYATEKATSVYSHAKSGETTQAVGDVIETVAEIGAMGLGMKAGSNLVKPQEPLKIKETKSGITTEPLEVVSDYGRTKESILTESYYLRGAEKTYGITEAKIIQDKQPTYMILQTVTEKTDTGSYLTKVSGKEITKSKMDLKTPKTIEGNVITKTDNIITKSSAMLEREKIESKTDIQKLMDQKDLIKNEILSNKKPETITAINKKIETGKIEGQLDLFGNRKPEILSEKKISKGLDISNIQYLETSKSVMEKSTDTKMTENIRLSGTTKIMEAKKGNLVYRKAYTKGVAIDKTPESVKIMRDIWKGTQKQTKEFTPDKIDGILEKTRLLSEVDVAERAAIKSIGLKYDIKSTASGRARAKLFEEGPKQIEKIPKDIIIKTQNVPRNIIIGTNQNIINRIIDTETIFARKPGFIENKPITTHHLIQNIDTDIGTEFINQQSQKINETLGTDVSQKSLQIPMSDTTTILDMLQNDLQLQDQSQNQTQKTQQEQQTEQQQKQIIDTVQDYMIKDINISITPRPTDFTPPPPPPITPIPGIIPFISSGKNRDSQTNEGYDVEVRKGEKRGDKFITVKRNIPRNMAIRTGKEITDEYIEASFRIKKSGKTTKEQDDFSEPNLYKYRRPKPNSKLPRETFVEKRKFRLDTPGEVQQISYFKEQAKKEKNIKSILPSKRIKVSNKSLFSKKGRRFAI